MTIIVLELEVSTVEPSILMKMNLEHLVTFDNEVPLCVGVPPLPLQ